MRTPHVILLLGAALLWAAGHVRAATPEAKLAYQQARDTAAAEYKTARARCDAIAGNPKDVCVLEAKAARVRADEEAQARCAGLAGNDKDVCRAQAKARFVAAQADAKADQKTIEARNEAREDKLAAAYRVATEKCDAFAGAAKDNCVSAAKAEFGK